MQVRRACPRKDRANRPKPPFYDEDAFIRIDREGNELQRIETPGRRAIACVLGGRRRQTLFCLSAVTSHQELRQGKWSARIDAVDLDMSGAGYP
jgi:sugar lactone lactonase YvrE